VKLICGGTDELLWAKLHAWDDPALKRQLGLVSLDAQFAWDEAAPTFSVSTKLRAIGPDVWMYDRAQPLSAIDAAFARRRVGYLRSKQGRWPMRVIPPQDVNELVC
jgi:hypothetical protein